MSTNERTELLGQMRDQFSERLAAAFSEAPIDEIRQALDGFKAQREDYARMGFVDETTAT